MIEAEPDDREQQANAVAESIATDASSQSGEAITIEPTNVGRNAFVILWNGEPTGRLQVLIPRAGERVRYSLQSVGRVRNYSKVSTLIDKIVELCRPLTDAEHEIEQKRARRNELHDQIASIEGDTGSLSRYLHIHRMALAGWLATMDEGDVPPGCRLAVKRMRELVEEAAELRAEEVGLSDEKT